MELNKIYEIDGIEGLKILPDHCIDLAVIDPPYNMGIDKWDIIENYKEFSEKWIKEVVRVIKPNKAIWVFGNHYNIALMKNCFDAYDLMSFRSWVIWNKGVGIPNPNNFSNLHEHILYYIKLPNKEIMQAFGEYIKSKRLELGLSLKEIGTLCGEQWYHRGGHLYFETGLTYPNVEQYITLKEVLKLDNRFDIWFDNHFVFNLKDVGLKWKYEKDKRNKRGWKNCGDVWDIPQLSGTFKERLEHPTQKPISLIKRIITVSSNEGDVILDLFSGTGTTAVVAKSQERKYIAIEKNKEYIKIIKERLQQQTVGDFSSELSLPSLSQATLSTER